MRQLKLVVQELISRFKYPKGQSPTLCTRGKFLCHGLHSLHYGCERLVWSQRSSKTTEDRCVRNKNTVGSE